MGSTQDWCNRQIVPVAVLGRLVKRDDGAAELLKRAICAARTLPGTIWNTQPRTRQMAK